MSVLLILCKHRLTSNHTASGSSSAFGRETVFETLDSGDKVVTALRKSAALDDLKKKYAADRLRIVKIDVTPPTDIDAAFVQAKSVFGRTNIVFNNAGFVAVGEIETFPDDVAQFLFEVPFWASPLAVCFFHERNKSQVWLPLQDSALVGISPRPR